MPTTDDTQLILGVIAKLEDPAKEASVLWLEDARFSEIEDYIPEPFGAETLRQIHDWIRKNVRPGDNVRFTDIKVHFLSPGVVYATAIQEQCFDAPEKSRVPSVFLRQQGGWAIIHAHYSTMPSG
jgi:hypothetical protein